MSIDLVPKAAEHQENTAKAPATAAKLAPVTAAKQPKLKNKVKYIASAADIPAGQNHVLVEYGAESGQKKHALGFTITVARDGSTSDLAFLANVHSAKELAKRENISAIFACKS